MLNKAAIRYTGYGSVPYPEENTSRLVDEVGFEMASRLELEVQQLLEEMSRLKPDWSAHTLVTAGAWAKAEMKRNHPELSQEALNALEWVFTWWWR